MNLHTTNETEIQGIRVFNNERNFIKCIDDLIKIIQEHPNYKNVLNIKRNQDVIIININGSLICILIIDILDIQIMNEFIQLNCIFFKFKIQNKFGKISIQFN
jgi:hypothetical protein